MLVLNDQAGSFNAEFEAICKSNAPEATIGSAKDIPSRPWDLIVACGGDGTVRIVVNAMIAAQSEARLGIVPLGTANVIARAMGLPQQPAEALKIALSGEERKVDVGLCHGEAFLLGCGLGLAERFVTTVGHAEKVRLGPLAYIKKLLSERDAPIVEFSVDQENGSLTMRGVGLVVANMAQIGPNVKPVAEVSPVDGRLGLILLKHSGLWDFARLAARALVGNASADDALDVVSVQKCRISSKPKVPIQIDGDAVDQEAPFEFEVLPSRLTIRVPSKTDLKA